MDSDSEEETIVSRVGSAALIKEEPELGDALVFDGEDMVLSPDDGALVPVIRPRPGRAKNNQSEVVVPVKEATVEVVPGIWDTNASSGMVLITPSKVEIFHISA